jgi:hypothetical protein
MRGLRQSKFLKSNEGVDFDRFAPGLALVSFSVGKAKEMGAIPGAKRGRVGD